MEYSSSQHASLLWEYGSHAPSWNRDGLTRIARVGVVCNVYEVVGL